MQLETAQPAPRGTQCGGGLWTRLVYHIDDNGQVANAVSSVATQPLSQDLLFVIQELRNYGLFSYSSPHVFILQEGRKLGYSAMPGVPMVATSPMRHDLSTMSPNGGQPIHSYEPPWKALCDFALHSDLDRPGYNHLVSEVSHFFFVSQPPGVTRRRGAA